MKIRDLLNITAMDKGLRRSTLLSYERLLTRMDLMDLDHAEVTRELVLERLWGIDNPNTRRSAVVAVRSVLGLQIRIPRGVPRRYDLPSEDTLRLALMLSRYETRGLLMMYGGLRVGEACAVTAQDVSGDRLRVDKQVVQLHRTGEPTDVRIGPVKCREADIVIPHWLAALCDTLADELVKPDSVRESLRRAGKKVGIDLSPHMMRHWFATTMLARGVPLSQVSRQMRHSSISTTLATYSQYDDSKIHDVFG